MNCVWLRILTVLSFASLQLTVAQKCFKKKGFTKDINFDELGKLDKWWEVKNNVYSNANDTNCLTLRMLKNTEVGGIATTQYVKGNFEISEAVETFVKIEPGSYKKQSQQSNQSFKSMHQLSIDSVGDGSEIVKRNQLIENYEVNWFTDYKDIIIMTACTESGQTLWSVFTSTPTPSRRYKYKMARILKRLGITVDQLQDTVCQEIE